ncbi:MAG: hypothetical protein ACF8QF_01135, partial [Phycisphaerales bacterium]
MRRIIPAAVLRRPRRTLGAIIAVALIVYGGVYAAVATAESPTDRAVTTADGRTLAYLRAGDEGAGRRV